MQPIWNALYRLTARLARALSLCLSAFASGDTPESWSNPEAWPDSGPAPRESR